MRKTCVRLGTVTFAILLSFSVAYGWGSATHAYIDERLNNKLPVFILNQVYGGMAPDLFNLMFDQPLLSCATHCGGFMRVWQVAVLPTGKALAYGFVSHNQLYAADSTAHFPGCPCGVGPTAGYINEKASELFLIMGQSLEGIPENVAMEVLRNIVEFGVDILIKRLDPLIGQKLVSSALLRSPEFPIMLVAAYANDFSAQLHISRFEAAKLITAAESDFRKTTMLYGQALTQDQETAIQLVSEQLAQLAASFLAAYHVDPPPGVDITQLVEFALRTAVGICKPDYKAAVNGTITTVRDGLTSHGISY